MRIAKLAVVMRTDLNMPKGKIGAHFLHAGRQVMMQDASIDETNREVNISINSEVMFRWLTDGLSTTVGLKVSSEDEVLDLHEKAKAAGIPTQLVYDAGLTMFQGKRTLTCVTIGPDYIDKVDEITGGLKLL